MTVETKRGLMAVLAVATIVAACTWIFFTQVRVVRHNAALHQRLGEVLAEQTASLIGRKGKIVTLSIETREWPELKTQIEAFKSALKKQGDYEIREYEMDTNDQPKYGVGSGLSGRRYVRTVNKNTNATVFVSFIGAPKLSAEEIAELAIKPKLIAEARGIENLPKLFKHQLIEIAVVSRFQYPAPGPIKPTTPDQWFTQRYQIVTAKSVSLLPPPE